MVQMDSPSSSEVPVPVIVAKPGQPKGTTTKYAEKQKHQIELASEEAAVRYSQE
jgi:hypothetical protein